MAFELSSKALLYSQATNVNQQLILEIEGLETLFGAVEVLKIAIVGEETLYIGDDWVIGGNIDYPNQKDYISMNKSSKNLTQQLKQDDGGTSSVSRIKIELIDKDGELTKSFNPGENIEDILSARAKVYLGFAQGAHPEDSIQIFSGLIDDVSFASGSALLSISSPEQLKRQEIFQQISTETTSLISDTAVIIPVDSTTGFIDITTGSTSDIETYIKINDEIIKYTQISGNNLTNCTRAQFGTIAQEHEDDSEVKSFYRLQGNTIDMALQLMLSGSGYYRSDVSILSFVILDDGTDVSNSILFANINIKEKYGVNIGDYITVIGATNSSNNVSNVLIDDIIVIESGSYIVVDNSSTLILEQDTNATISFKSKYDTYPTGCGLGLNMEEVDVFEHTEINTIYGSAFHTYDHYLFDTITGKSFIEDKIYYPSGLYSIPRKGKSSVGSTNPPLASDSSKKVGLADVKNPDQIKINRSINKNFYNSIVYKYDESPINENKYLRGTVTTNEDSLNRIVVGSRPKTITAGGVRSGGKALINLQSRKFLDRYKFAAEYLQVDLMYKTGFNIEVGDTIIFGDNELQISDIKSGTRNFEPRLMEVTNKKLNIQTGSVQVELTDTAFEIDGRFISLSPASRIGVGSTTSKLILKKQYTLTGSERTKWEQYVGQEIVVRNDSYSVSETASIISFDPVNNNAINISPSLGFVPDETYLIEAPDYSGDSDNNNFWKSLHGFMSPTVNITGGSSSSIFTVDDTSELFVGASIYINNDDYSINSQDIDAKITDITSLTVTVDKDLGFTPVNGMELNSVGFISDSGGAYLLT